MGDRTHDNVESSDGRGVNPAEQVTLCGSESGTNAGGFPVGATHVGGVVGGYRLERRLGGGGQGSVFEARSQADGQRVAIKVNHAPSGADAVASSKRFALEGRIMSKLEHPAIARVLGVGAVETGAGSHLYSIMEYIDGVPLDDYAEQRSLSVKERIALLALVADGFAFAHVEGVIHRDIAPKNILVTPAGAPKIVDFGIARVMGSGGITASYSTQTGQVLGTVPYMAPEQVAGRAKEADSRTDVYSFGVVCYEVLTGVLPVDTEGMELFEAARVIEHETPAPMARHSRSISGDIDTVVAKCLRKEPARRYQTMADLAEDLRNVIEHRPVSARAPSVGYVLSKYARRNRVALAVVGSAVVATGAGALAYANSLMESARGVVARQTASAANHVAQDALIVNGQVRYGAARVGAASSAPISPGMSDVDLNIAYDNIYEKAMLSDLHDTGSYEWAHTRCTELVEARPGNHDYLATRGVLEYRLGRLDAAIATLADAATLRRINVPNSTDFPMADGFRAMALFDAGRGAEAQAVLRHLRIVVPAEHSQHKTCTAALSQAERHFGAKTP